MISNYTIRSKVSIKPKKKAYLLKILLNICLVIVMIAGIIKIVFDGLDIGTIGVMALTIVIVSLYNKKPSNVEHYEFALVDASFSNDALTLIYRQIESYKNKDYQVNIPLSEITALEFSDCLSCLHICGKITSEVIGGNKKMDTYHDHFLYLEQGMEEDFIASIQTASGIRVKYMDRS